VHCQFKEPARLNDELLVRTGIEPSEVANLIFTYAVLHAETERILATGRTIHVLTDSKGMEYLEVER
jgi:acyl-CoA thioester hydrolase